MRCLSFACLLVVATSFAARPLTAAERPNIVWIVSEDNSKHFLRHFDPAGAVTPNIERLAKEGLTFDRAFSNAPVCSVARTTLATCVYAPRLGTQYHRKTRQATLPEGWQMFPAYLREAGYYTTNNSKKDYNAVEGSGVWDASSKKATWRNRKEKSQPFFHMESHPASHESSLHFSAKQMKQQATTTDPQQVQLAPYHPDTPTFRYTYARYHDRMVAIDKIVGDTVKRLEEDGLLEDTFVFYFGDHGGVLPRGKGYVYESGLHVPLVVRVPENFKQLANAPRGTRVSGFVEFVDFGATVLNLAGVAVPKHFDGRPFLGPGVTLDEVNARQETLGYADRFDEKYELIRTLRRGKWKYHRNYQAHHPDGLQNNYRYRMLAYQEWRQLSEAGKLNEAQQAFFAPKAVEALYNLEDDPHETKNLAADAAHRETLVELRNRLRERLKAMPDLSFVPESVLVSEVVPAPIEYGQQQKARLAKLIDTVDLALLPFAEAKPRLEKAFASEDPIERQWALTACASLGKTAAPLAEQAQQLLNDNDPLTRVRAAEFLGQLGGTDLKPAMLDVLKSTSDYPTAAIALNSIVYLRDALKIEIPVSRAGIRAKGDSVNRRLEYLAPSK